jgi:hypothetical protein
VRAKHWREARSWYGRSALIFDQMRARGTLTGLVVQDAEKVARELVRCEQALRELPVTR